MLRWWEEADQPNAWRRLALLGLLFGLDFSVHRTNALLMPGALVWILLRHPRTLRAPRVWLGGAGGVIAGLAVQLLIIPIAAFTRSSLNFGDPSTLPRFWDYISLAQRGGGFLVQFFPRNAPFWSVQVADLLRVLGADFFSVTAPACMLGVLPGMAAVGGLVALWRRDRRLALALSSLLQHPGAVFPVVRPTLPPRVRDDRRARGVRPVRGTAGGDRRATDAATGTCHGDNRARRARPGGAAHAQLAVARGV